MTNREAIAAMMPSHSVEDNVLEKHFIDSCDHFGVQGNIDNTYTVDMKRPVALSAMFILAALRDLQVEKVDVISNTWDTSKFDKEIAAIAASADLSPSLVGAEDDNYNLTSVKCW